MSDTYTVTQYTDEYTVVGGTTITVASGSGVAGPAGATGAAGTNGAAGAAGATGPQGPAGADGTSVTNGAATIVSVSSSAGDYAVTSTAGGWVALDTGLDLVVPTNGNVQNIEFLGNFLVGQTPIFFDVAVMVSGSPVRYFSSGTATPCVEGPGGWYPISGGAWNKFGGFIYTTQAGDIVANTVTLRLFYKTTGATVYADTNYVMRLWAINHSRIVLS